jgi:hypothetical protein
MNMATMSSRTTRTSAAESAANVTAPPSTGDTDSSSASDVKVSTTTNKFIEKSGATFPSASDKINTESDASDAIVTQIGTLVMLVSLFLFVSHL